MKPTGKKNEQLYMIDSGTNFWSENAAISAMNDSTAFDSMLMESNAEYMDRISKAVSTEYEILRLNMEKAETDKERDAIRKVMADIRKECTEKDTENKDFCERLQKEHNENNKRILYSIIVTLGLGGLGYRYRKSLINAGRKPIAKV